MKLIITAELEENPKDADNFEDACFDIETAVKEMLDQYGYKADVNWRKES